MPEVRTVDSENMFPPPPHPFRLQVSVADLPPDGASVVLSPRVCASRAPKEAFGRTAGTSSSRGA